ncbi:oxidoreductase [Chitinophaga pendula]|uniref:oxidoreductase n=1 Tax=Chitinophaga TaxID=79328 RepID=UPI000BAF7ED7|nr:MULTISPECIES: oxidoreductase [Chitinophaga]ASZ13522.1 oxidoreductase [Chitinophaga sp. MD30]UCJ08845.1 oxidoreductase [Chitinophaga pendula]
MSTKLFLLSMARDVRGFLLLLTFAGASIFPARVAAQGGGVLPEIQSLVKGPIQSIRGMSVVSDQVVWVSGTEGMVGRSTDGGKNWSWQRVAGCDSCDWRDISAFSDQKAIVVNAGAPAHIYATADGGISWQRVYFNDAPGIFLDGMDFANERDGVIIGDPMGGRFFMLRTNDGGQHWRPVDGPVAEQGEALFAASGSGIRLWPDGTIYFATGGTVSRFFVLGRKHTVSYKLPVVQGEASTGVFSLAFYDKRKGIAVGGDYMKDTVRQGNCALTMNGGRRWELPVGTPYGYRSAVVYIDAHRLLATGPGGTDISLNGGKDWRNISRAGYHVAQRALHGRVVYLAGQGGRIAKVVADSAGDRR